MEYKISHSEIICDILQIYSVAVLEKIYMLSISRNEADLASMKRHLSQSVGLEITEKRHERSRDAKTL